MQEGISTGAIYASNPPHPSLKQFFFFAFFLRTTPAARGSSQARG